MTVEIQAFRIVDPYLDEGQIRCVEAAVLLAQGILEERLAAWAPSIVEAAAQTALSAVATQLAAANTDDVRAMLREVLAEARASIDQRIVHKDILRDVHGDIVRITERPEVC